MTDALANGSGLQGLVLRELASCRPDADLDSTSFLAAGEYTLNYRVSLAGRDAVLRIVTGSQMGLDPQQQAKYEAQALETLRETQRVPKLIAVESRPAVLDYPYLLLPYLPGGPLDYRADLVGAAQCVAAIHRHALPPDHQLQVHADPVSSVLAETGELLGELPAESSGGERIRGLAARVGGMSGRKLDLVRNDQAIINTDLNSHNFIVDDGYVRLIDWEKARIGPTLLDIAHFLLPTTTLWRDATARRLDGGQRETFISAYLAARPELDTDAYRSGLQAALQLAAVRALAWCAWAVDASRRGERAIENEETLSKCRLYTSNDFLDGLIAELWD